MLNLLSSFRIPFRLTFQVILFTIGLITMVIVSSNQLYSSLLESKQKGTQQLVESAHSVLESYYKLFEAGKLSEDDAKQSALQQISEMRYDGNNYFWVNDMDAVMIMHPVKPALNGKNLADFEDPSGKKLFSEFVKVVKANGEGEVDYMWPAPDGDQPIDKISYVKGFAPWGYIVGSGAYIQDITATFWNNAQILMVALLIIISVVGAVSILIVKSITKPISTVVDALNNIAQGDGDLTQRLPILGKDEISVLSKNFNIFSEKLHGVVKQTHDTAISVMGTATQNKQVFSDISQSVDNHQRQIDSMAESVNMMSDSSNNTLDKVSQASSSADQANEYCVNVKDVVTKNISSVTQLVDEVGKASGVINTLKEDVGNIVSVLDVIRGIAEQTNLLALNAAIEAARAGEQGRGFAVVADEVRTLASRTQDSTQEIQGMIEKLQKGSEMAVDAMQSSQEVGKNTVEHSNVAGQSLDDITNAVSEISNLNSVIAKLMKNQSKTTDTVQSTLSELLDESKKSSETTEKSAEMSANLENQVAELTQVIGQFKTH